MSKKRVLKSLKDRLSGIFQNNSFAHGVGVLVSGTAASQLLMALAAPILTRLYTPEDFGMFAVYTGLFTILDIVSSLRYELAIPLPKDDQDAAHVAVLGLLIVVVSTGVTLLLVLFFSKRIAVLAGVPKLAGYLWLLPCGVLLQGFSTVFNYWAIRTKQFSIISGTQFRRGLGTVAIQLSGYKAGGISLLFAAVGSQCIGSFSLGKMIWFRPEFRQITWDGLKRAAHRYKQFPMYSTLASFFNSSGSQLPPLIFAVLFSSSAAGLYALANRVLAMPMALVGNAVGNVFFSNAVDAHRKGTLGILVTHLHDRLAHIAMPPVLVLVVVGPDIFALIFGEKWRMAGEFARWLALPLYGSFVTSPLSQVFSIIEKQGVVLFLQVLLFVTRIIMILVGVYYHSLLLAIALFSVGSLICYLLYVVIVVRFSGGNGIIVFSSLAKSFLLSIICVAPLIMYEIIGGAVFSIFISFVSVFFLLLIRYFFIIKNQY
ncbi:MAG: oligosaccharide flippase family protein [Chlorobium sp.]|jgi:O-antigen/teichoic acid export membrane protein|nr:oligosaccharide flippase family protein [Chlorobium sp.]